MLALGPMAAGEESDGVGAPTMDIARVPCLRFVWARNCRGGRTDFKEACSRAPARGTPRLEPQPAPQGSFQCPNIGRRQSTYHLPDKSVFDSTDLALHAAGD